MIGADSYAWAANPAVGAKSIADVVALAKSRKDSGGEPITSSSPGAGSLGHLLLERFKRKAGIDIRHVPAPNSGVTDVLGNRISLTLTTMMTIGDQVKAGRLTALAVTSAERNPAFKGIPTSASKAIRRCTAKPGSGCADPRTFRSMSSTKLSDTTRRIVKGRKDFRPTSVSWHCCRKTSTLPQSGTSSPRNMHSGRSAPRPPA